MKSMSKAIEAGIQNSAIPLTVSLQQAATNLGWDNSASKRVRVRTNGENKLAINAQGPAPETAEYGSLGSQPSPAIRQWVSDEATVEAILVSSIMSEMEAVSV